jgi:hypothetical protein
MSRLIALVVLVASLAVPASATASWSAVGGGSAVVVQAETLPVGSAPTSVTVSGRDVVVGWPQTSYHGSYLGALSGGGYILSRVPASGGTSVTPNASCATLISGSSPILTCTERGVPAGTWKYSVTTRFQGWSGTASAPSGTVTVSSPTIILSGSPFSTLPTTLSGQVANFYDNEPLSFRLDNATSGTILASSPATANGNGSANVTATIPTGTSVGSHTIYAIGGQGSQATTVVTYAPAPAATALAIANGGTAAKPDTGDTIRVTYDQALSVSSLCSTWTNDAQNQSLSGATATLTKVTSTTSQFAVTALASGCGGAFHLGTIGGLPKYFSGSTSTAAFTNSTLSWNATSRQLTLTLGSTTTSLNTSTGPSTATYTPDAAIQSSFGTAISNASQPTQTATLF